LPWVFYQIHREAVAYADGHFRKNKGGATPSYIAAVLGRAKYIIEIDSLDRFAQVLVTGISRAGDESFFRLGDYILNARRAKGRNRKPRSQKIGFAQFDREQRITSGKCCRL
jgi:hypothetical protein